MPSTAISQLFYDTLTRDLRVTFVTGRRYIYAGVPVQVFDAFRSAPSRGVFFNREIRDNYACREISREPAE